MFSYFDLRRSLIFGDKMSSGPFMVRKGTKNQIGNDVFSLISYYDLLRSLISQGQMPSGSYMVREGTQNGIRTLIWYLTRLIFIAFIFWHPEVGKFWSSRPPGSSEVIKGSQNEFGTTKNLWFDTWHDPFSSIKYFDFQR